jgi:hypothetical protein
MSLAERKVRLATHAAQPSEKGMSKATIKQANDNRAGVTPMHNTNEVSRKHRGLRRAVAKEIRRYHDDLVLSLSIDNEHFMQQTFAKARSRPTRQRGERV